MLEDMGDTIVEHQLKRRMNGAKMEEKELWWSISTTL